MAGNLIADSALERPFAGAMPRAGRLGIWPMVRAVLVPLASLRLTVALLVTSVVVTWLATLQQTRMDIWDVKRAHFPALVTPIDFEVLFPPAWFPEMNRGADLASGAKAIPGRFFVPSGFLLILLMLVNLCSAHLLRMRIQATGLRLWWGLAIMAAGAVAAWLVVFAGQNPEGFQASFDTAFFQALWTGILVLLLGLAVLVAVLSARLPAERTAARVAGWFGAAVMMVTAGTLLAAGQRTFVGDSTMRILWQLIQGSIVAGVMLAGATLAFRRKGGIVVVHLGITLLLANEIWVTLTNVEQRMQLFEGQQAMSAVDIRSAELFVADLADPAACRVIQVPGSRLGAGRVIRDVSLPFVVECLEWHANAGIVPLDSAEPRRVTAGWGRDFRIDPRPLARGVDEQSKVNLPAGIVRLTDRQSGEDLGTWMVSQLAEENGVRERVTAGGREWAIGLRFTHHYKPWGVRLIDTRSETYVGTSTPRTYESIIAIDDPRHGMEGARRKVSMNNPLRYGNETFYQSGYQKLPDGREYSVLQVVQNKGWMIPYVACMFVVIGLVGHFAGALVGFLERAPAAVARGESPTGESGTRTGGSRWVARLALLVPLAVAVLFAGRELGKNLRPLSVTASGQSLPLESFGRIPVVLGGRVQPLESVARNAARRFGQREYVYGANDSSTVPALRWLADTVFEAEGFEDYRIFRIEDPGVLDELGLPRRKGFRYSWREMEKAAPVMEAQLAAARKLDEGQWTSTQKRLLELQGRLGELRALKAALGDPARMQGEFLQQTDHVNRIVRAPGLVLGVPTGDPVSPWIPLSAAHWIERLAGVAQESGGEINAVADRIAETELIAPLREQFIREEMISLLMADAQMLELFRRETGLQDPEAIRRELGRSFDRFPPAVYKSLVPLVEPRVDAVIAARRAEWQSDVRTLVRGVFGELPPALPAGFRSGYEHLLRLGQAWRDRDGATFDREARAHLEAIRGTTVTGPMQRGLAAEWLLNRTSPLYLATVFYLLAAICCAASWVGQRRPLLAAAGWLVWLAIVAQGTALVLRMIVSGRPPVTNLYSSFVFVSLGSAVLLQIVERWTRQGIGTLLAAVFGAVALLWAWSISVADGDTMVVLVAVLDTQFWLSTHVICISLGYAATAAAGLLGLAWLLRAGTGSRFDKTASRGLLNVVYGVAAFALLLSFFGTVLGGLWADDSWGRFWGWDPKENGALMIVLWNAVLLHARWAGLVRDRGIAALAVLGIVVTLWSWEGVNLLNVGLHAYAGSEAKLVSFDLFGQSIALTKRGIVFGLMGCLAAISLAGLIPRPLWRSPAVRAA